MENKYKIKLPWMVLLIVPFITLLSTIGCSSKKYSDTNIVLIVIDALRSDHLPFYGYQKNTAPFLDQLAEKSVVFENAFSASSWTPPATASIFTSLLPYQHGVLKGLLVPKEIRTQQAVVKVDRIPEKIQTMTEVLKGAGYFTFGISDNLNIGEKQGFDQGFDHFETYSYKTAPFINKIVKQWKPRLKKEDKYFLYIHYMEPHAPYHERKPWFKNHEDIRKRRISAYDSEINYVDSFIKELYEYMNWEENTIIIVTSDHGEGLWDHGMMGHGSSLYREQIQVPLLFYLPKGKKSGRIAANSSTIDILPTLRSLIGLSEDKTLSGLDLTPLIFGKAPGKNKRYIYSYLMIDWPDPDLKSNFQVEFRSTIYNNWHYHVRMPKKRELFNLISDNKEQKNHISKGKNIANLLASEFNLYMKKSKKYSAEPQPFRLDKKKLEKLKNLGYIQE